MPQIPKPNTLNKIWAAGGDRATPLDGKISSGWQIEIPPRQWFNWLDNRQDQAIAHFNQHGIPVWDDQTEYQAGKSYVQDPGNGLVYRCVITNTGNQPALTPSHRSEEHTSELQSRPHLVCRLLLEKKKSTHRFIL